MGSRDWISKQDEQRLSWLSRGDGPSRLRTLDDDAIERARAWSRDLLDRLAAVEGPDGEALRARVTTTGALVEAEWLRRGETLRQAAVALWGAADEGAWCPLCRKWVRRYWQRLNGSMARGLAWIVLAARRSEIADGEGWVHVPTHGPRWLVRTNQHASLRLFGLVERRAPDEESRVKCSGWWRPTERGFAFVDGLVDVEDRVLTYNGEVVARGEARLRFRDVLDVAFDYAALMATPGTLPATERAEPFEHEEDEG